MRLKTHRTVLAAFLAFAMLAVACGGDDGDSSDDATQDAAADDEASDDEASDDEDADETDSAEERVLRLWHYEGPNSAMGIAWQRAMEILEEENPGVTVDFEEKGFEQIRETASMVLNSNEAPDIMEYNKGNATAGLLSNQGLLTDLSDVVAQHGWDELISPSIATIARYDNGVMGSGNWYGVPNYAEFVMFYYNQDLFDEHGVDVPSTLEELESVMDTFVDAGVTPLAFSGSEYPAQQVWYSLALTQADRSFVDAFQLYEGDLDFQGPEMTFGADRLLDWVDAGYVSTDALGLPAEDMGTSFIGGTHPMLLSGSWWYGRFVDEIEGFEWSTFLFPGADLYPGSGGNIWVVPEGAANKDLAYEFIDITMREEIQNILGNAGGVPVAADPAAITDPKSQELVERFNAINDADGLAFYPDWPVPGYYDTLVANVQDLVSGRQSTSEFLSSIEQPFADHVATVER